MAGAGWLTESVSDDDVVFVVGGRWDIDNAGRLDADLQRVAVNGRGRVRVDASALDFLDTAGAWLLHRLLKGLRDSGVEAELQGVRPEHNALLQQVADSYEPCEIEPPRINPVVRFLSHLGMATVGVVETCGGFVSFFGETVLALFKVVIKPRRLRLTSVVYHIEEVGINALPIVCLISVLIGVVLAYQGAQQLTRFGAEIFVVDLLAISVLREIAVLLTAIVIAGRSGSAFTAQIGSMKLNEEVDAMRTLGLDPIEVLVVPRVVALTVALPILVFFADMLGLLGGGIMSWVALDIAPTIFLDRLNLAIGMWSFWVGLIKAPFFAILISMIGCYEGLQVSGSAESVGRRTTRSVVEAIFLVIICDAFFSVFFGIVGV